MTRWFRLLSINHTMIWIDAFCSYRLETKFLEEPLVFTNVVSLLKLLFDFCASTCSFASIFQNVFVDICFVQCNIYAVSCGHQMVVVDNFKEWLDFGALCNLFLSHRLGDFSWIFVNTSNKSMAIRAILSSIIIVFHNDGFTTGIFSSKNKNHLSRFHKLAHVECVVYLSSTKWFSLNISDYM